MRHYYTRELAAQESGMARMLKGNMSGDGRSPVTTSALIAIMGSILSGGAS